MLVKFRHNLNIPGMLISSVMLEDDTFVCCSFKQKKVAELGYKRSYKEFQLFLKIK